MPTLSRPPARTLLALMLLAFSLQAFAELLVGSGDDGGRLTLHAEPEWTCHEGMGANECVFSFVAPNLIDVAPVDSMLHIEASQNALKYIGGVGPSPYGIWDFQFTVPASTEK